MKGTRAIVLLLPLSAIVSLAGCSAKPPRPTASSQIMRNVSVIAAQPATVSDLLEALGTVRAAQTSVLSSQIMGGMLEVRVQEGDRVRRGDVLVVIDNTQSRAALDRATAADLAVQQQLAETDSDLSLAQTTLKRYQSLYEKKSVSPQEFDEMQARYRAALARRDMVSAEQAQARAAVIQARITLDYSRIRAPFDGAVTERKVDPGSLASPGMPILTIEDVRQWRLEATVNEADLSQVHLEESVPIVIDAIPQAQLKGKVTQIVPVADVASRSFLVKILLPADTRLRSGLFGRAQFSRGERRVLLIPRNAVIERGQLRAIFVLDANGVASLRYISLGKSSGESIEVLAGLQAGERLVSKPRGLELDGKHIEAGQ